MDTYTDILVDGIPIKRQFSQRLNATERFHFFQLADSVAMVIQNLQLLQLTEYLQHITNHITIFTAHSTYKCLISSCHSHSQMNGNAAFI